MSGVRVWNWPLLLLGLLALTQGASQALAQVPNERDVRPEQNVLDKDELYDKSGKNFRPDSKVWVMHFRFKDPRLITVDIPGRGRKLCWYLWYQVINRTSEPRTFIPEFELVTLDRNTTHRDQVLPRVQEAIRLVEDPTNSLNIRNSVTIAAEPIPVTREDGPVRAVTGVAIWDDVDQDSNRYTIYVSGLSNGWAVTDPPPGEKDMVVRRKTLQLDFKRVGDRFYQESREIQFLGPAQWVYRAAKLKTIAAPVAKPPAKP